MKNYLFYLVVIINCLDFASASAQITPDDTLPSDSVVERDGEIIQIDGGTTAGKNLFHSFEDFSVPIDDVAFFNNSLAIERIFSRVTGDSISEINGMLRANGAADLFLINPNGIIFGQDASLDIGGSFIGSTADSIKFNDGIEFSASKPQTSPILTVSVPIGLGFGNDPGAITVRGTGNNIIIRPSEIIRNNRPVGLQVDAGKTLGLVGGSISLEKGNLTAEGGRIELGSVGSREIVRLIPKNSQWSLNYQGVEKFQEIQLSQASSADASGNSGGSIQVQGRQVNLVDNSVILTETLGNSSGGNLILKASESIDLVTSNIYNITRSTGESGDLVINTENLRVFDGSQIGNLVFDAGNYGNLNIIAENIEVKGVNPLDPRLPSALGTAVFLEAIGNGGDVTIEANRLTVSNGGQIQSVTVGSGNAGNLDIIVSDIKITGEGSLGSSGLFAAAIIEDGNSGNINVVADSLIINDGATISVSNFPNLDRRPPGLGSPGNINIRAETISLEEGSIIANTLIGNRGNIILDANSIQLKRSVISANSSVGQGGNIQISTRGLFQSPDSDITASSELGIDGDVNINTTIDFKNSFDSISTEFILAEEALIGSCFTRGNSKQGSFVYRGTGGLPVSPSSAIDEEPSLSSQLPEVQANSLTSHVPADSDDITSSAETVIYPAQTARKWQVGEPIIEPTNLIKTADGRLLWVRKQVDNALSLICQ